MDFLQTIGDCQRKLEQFEASTKTYNTALELRFDSGDKNSNYKIKGDIIHNKAENYRSLNKLAKAMKCFKQSLETKQNRLDSAKQYSIALTLNSIGICYEELGEFQKALDEYCKAREHLKGAKDNQDTKHLLSMLSNNEGICLEELGHFEKALKAYENDLAVRKEINASAEDMAKTLGNIANVLSAQGKHQDALEKNNESLKKFREHYGQDAKTVNIAMSLNNIGREYTLLEKYSEAGKCFREALSIKQINYHSKNHPDTAHTLHVIGLNYHDQGDEIHKAEENLQNAYNMIVQCDGYENLKSKIMIDFSCFLIAQNKPEEATKLLNEALDNYKERMKKFEENTASPTLAECFHMMGYTYRLLKNHSQAKIWFEKALEMRRIVFTDENQQPKNHSLIAQTLGELGQNYNEQDDEDSAQKYLDDSIKMFMTQTGKGSRDLVSKVEKYLEDFNAKVSNFCWVSNE